AAPTVFAIRTFQVQGAPVTLTPPTLFVLVAVSSGVGMLTVSEQALLVSLFSATRRSGSTAHVPPARGFTNGPWAVAVAVKLTTSPHPAGMIVPKPVAKHTRLNAPSMAQVVFGDAPPVGVTVTGP